MCFYNVKYDWYEKKWYGLYIWLIDWVYLPLLSTQKKSCAAYKFVNMTQTLLKLIFT